MSDLKGCGDSLCYIEKPKGMATNGGCRCRPHKLNGMIMRLRKRVKELEGVVEAGDSLAKTIDHAICAGMLTGSPETDLRVWRRLTAKLEEGE